MKGCVTCRDCTINVCIDCTKMNLITCFLLTTISFVYSTSMLQTLILLRWIDFVFLCFLTMSLKTEQTQKGWYQDHQYPQFPYRKNKSEVGYKCEKASLPYFCDGHVKYRKLCVAHHQCREDLVAWSCCFVQALFFYERKKSKTLRRIWWVHRVN